MARSSRCSVNKAAIAIVIAVLSAIFVTPVLGMIIAVQAGNLQQELEARPELLRAPYSRFLRPTQIVAYSLGFGEGMLVSVTMVVGPMIAFWKPGWLLFLLSLWDAIQSAGHLAAVILQADFLPVPLWSCRNADQWAFSGAKPSVFQVLAGSAVQRKQDYRTAVDQCGRFLYVRRLQIATIIFLLIREAIVFFFVSPILYRKVGKRAVPPVRFAYRYFEKWRQYRAEMASCKADSPNDQPWELEDTLGNVHHIDMRNLMLVSKAIRNAVLMSGTGMLLRNTCSGGTKTSCWSCGNQICKRCKNPRTLPIPKHPHRCNPCCYKCYYRICCRPGRRRGQNVITWRRPPRCNCRASVDLTSHGLCRACAELDEAAVVQKKEARTAPPQHSTDPTVACGVCGDKLLSDGPRWWYCGRCKKECACDEHLNWLERSKGYTKL